MKAITTKFLGQTETLPSRIVAFDLDQNRIVVSVHDCPECALGTWGPKDLETLVTAWLEHQ